MAVIGPASNFTQELLANYHGWNTVVNTHSPWMALKQRLGSRLVSFELGCERRVTLNGVLSCDVMDNGTGSIAAAVEAAKAADTVLMFVGTNPIGNVVSCSPASTTCRSDAHSSKRALVRPGSARAFHTEIINTADCLCGWLCVLQADDGS